MRYIGAYRSANVGISNDKIDEKSIRRKSKVSPSMLIKRRLGGPKLNLDFGRE